MDTLAEIPTEELRLQLEADERVIARARSRQAARIVELARRQTAVAEGCASMVEWVSGRLDVAPETAQRLVATAEALSSLPHVAGSVSCGEITWDRTVEVAKGATPADELEALLCSYEHDIAGLRRLRARKRRMTRGDERRSFAERHLSFQPTLDQTSVRLTGVLPGAMGVELQAAVDARADQFPSFPDGTRAPLPQRRADALVSLVADSVGGGEPPVVVVNVDAADAASSSAETGVALVAGPRIGVDALEAILCDAVVEVTADAGDGSPLAVGRRSRTIPPRLRRHVLARDDGCTVAGCVSTYRLQAHHRVPYSEGGRTDPDNLTTLCWYHHQVVVHGHGFTIDRRSPRGRIRLRPPEAPRPPPGPTVAAQSHLVR